MAYIEKILFKDDGKWKEYDNLTLDALKFEGSKNGISFISSEGNKRIVDDEIKGFCHNRFKGNFVVKGMDLKQLYIGQILKLGDASIEVSRIGKDCHGSCPIVVDTKKACQLNKHIFFGEIVKEGLVNKNDDILV